MTYPSNSSEFNHPGFIFSLWRLFHFLLSSIQSPNTRLRMTMIKCFILQNYVTPCVYNYISTSGICILNLKCWYPDMIDVMWIYYNRQDRINVSICYIQACLSFRFDILLYFLVIVWSSLRKCVFLCKNYCNKAQISFAIQSNLIFLNFVSPFLFYYQSSSPQKLS